LAKRYFGFVYLPKNVLVLSYHFYFVGKSITESTVVFFSYKYRKHNSTNSLKVMPIEFYFLDRKTFFLYGIKKIVSGKSVAEKENQHY